MRYFNTTQEKGEQLKSYVKKARKQDYEVFGVFIDEDKEMGASEVYKKLRRKVLLTSVRRSINSLVKDGLLIATGNKKRGIYGRNELTWEINF